MSTSNAPLTNQLMPSTLSASPTDSMPSSSVRSLAQEKYQQWLAIPRKYRAANLRTHEQIKAALGVDDDTIAQWEAEPGWWDDTFAVTRRIIGRQMADILESTAREAIKGSVPAQKLAYQLMGVAAEKVEHKVSIEEDRLVVIVHATPEEVAQLRHPEQLPPPQIVEAGHARLADHARLVDLQLHAADADAATDADADDQAPDDEGNGNGHASGHASDMAWLSDV